MKKAYKQYKCGDWIITASTVYNDWELQPAGLSNFKAEEFDNEQEVRFPTLEQAKEWTKTADAEWLRQEYLELD